MTLAERIARWFYPKIFSDFELSKAHIAYANGMEKMWRELSDVANRPVPYVRTVSELKNLLPVGILVEESQPGILTLYADREHPTT